MWHLTGPRDRILRTCSLSGAVKLSPSTEAKDALRGSSRNRIVCTSSLDSAMKASSSTGMKVAPCGSF